MELAALKLGGKASVAAALSLIEADLYSGRSVALLEAALENPKGLVTGITGPPGAGKSTLINALIVQWRKAGFTVAVLAVDPSSKASKGALLGDRVRMRTDPDDDGVFVRSIAARGRLGGLSDGAYPSAVLLRALYGKVVVESVGVGQSETDIEGVCDTVVLCVQPGSGDSLQFMKAGIVEIPDIAVVTKADMGALANRALSDLKGALSLSSRGQGEQEPVCLALSSSDARAVTALTEAISLREAWLREDGRLPRRRSNQAALWLQSEIVTQFGRQGLAYAKTHLGIALSDDRPFATAAQLLAQMAVQG